MKNQTFLVTGAAGFIGSRFVHSCQNKPKVQIISADHLEHFKNRPEHAEIRFEKTIDRLQLFEWLTNEKPAISAIFHLGACTDTTESDGKYLTKMNLEYSITLWTYATKNKIPFIYASSAATYGNGETGYDDDEKLLPELKPLNLYGESKQLFDLWALEQESKGFHPPTWAGFKFFNVYGLGERHKRTTKANMSSVVLQAFDQIQANEKMRLFKSHRTGIADGHQKRDFIFVDDVVDVLHFAVHQPIRRGIFNLGTGQARTFLDLVRAVFQSLGKPEKIEFMDTPQNIREHYQYFTEAKMDRLRKVGYTQPFTSLEKGVRKYIQELINR